MTGERLPPLEMGNMQLLPMVVHTLKNNKNGNSNFFIASIT